MDDPELESSRRGIHIDNQFRLLREDMLAEIREELKILTGVEPGRHRGMAVENLSLAGVEMGTERKRLPWGVVLRLKGELPQLKKIPVEKRKNFLKDNRHILRHGNMACLIIDNEVTAFPTIHRGEDELAQTPATIAIQFTDDSMLSSALSKMKTAGNIKLVQLDTAIFAFEPFLRRLQEIVALPLAEEILHWEEGKAMECPSFQPEKIIKALNSLSGKDLKDFLQLKKSVVLDDSQMRSLCTCLFQRVSLVQGPPGECRFLLISFSFLTGFRNWQVPHRCPSGQGPIRLYVAEDTGSLFHKPCSRSIPRGTDGYWHSILRNGPFGRKVHGTDEAPDDSRAG
jgi:hypothetical protein